MDKTDAVVLRGLDDDQLDKLNRLVSAQNIALARFEELQQKLHQAQAVGHATTDALTTELESLARGAGIDPAGYSLSLGDNMILAERKEG